MKRTHVVVVGLVGMITAACAAAARGPDDAELARRCDEQIVRATLGQFWGYALVAKDGEVVFGRGYGVRDGRSMEPIDGRTVFDMGSVSKQFTAAAVLRLAETGKLSVDDGVEEFFPGVRGAEGVTLRHLLTHTAGIDDRSAMQSLDFADRDEAVRLALAARRGAPGERFAYANGGFVVLAAVIEKVSGRGFDEFVREEVLTRAGMEGAGLLDGSGVATERGAARVVGGTHRGILQDGWGWGLRGAGGVLASAENLLAWDRALSDGRVLSAASRELMFTPDENGTGMGWFIDETAAGTRVRHGGSTRGFRAALWRYPDTGWLVVVLTNESNDPESIARRLARAAGLERREGFDVTLAVGPYQKDETGVVEVAGPGVSLVVMPGYNGQSEDGRVIADPRPTLVVQDPQRRMWAVIARMGDEAAGSLIVALDALAADAGAPEGSAVKATLSTEGLELNQHGVALLSGGMAWRAAGPGRIELFETNGGRVLAAVSVGRGAAATAAAELRGLLGG